MHFKGTSRWKGRKFRLGCADRSISTYFFSPLSLFQRTLLTPAYRPPKSSPLSFVMPSSILSHKTGKGSALTPFNVLFPFSYSWSTLGCCCARSVKSTQYLERKHLVVNSEHMADLSTGQRRILPYVLSLFLLERRIAEREMVLGDWEWRLRVMVVPVGGEVFGERQSLCPFD